jgi:opacity protein-like surface antigen
MKRTWLLTLVMITTLAAGAHAAPGAIWGGMNGGISMPFGHFSDKASTGFTLGLIGEYMKNDSWAFGGELGWHKFGGNDDLEKSESARLGVPVNFTVRAIPITAHAKYLLPPSERIAPFVKAGLGFYNLKFKTDAGTLGDRDKSETDFGFQVGGGFNFKSTGNVAFGTELLYHYISTETQASNMFTLRMQLLFAVAGQ